MDVNVLYLGYTNVNILVVILKCIFAKGCFGGNSVKGTRDFSVLFLTTVLFLTISKGHVSQIQFLI